MPIPAILTVNAGSSTLKFALFGLAGGPALARGLIDGIGTDAATLRVTAADGGLLADETHTAPSGFDHAAAVARLLAWTENASTGGRAVRIAAVGHRVVHGGDRYVEPVLIDDAVLAALAAIAPLAPLHQPHNLAGIAAMRRRHAEIPQVACFDTAFHATQSAVERSYALPRALTDRGLRRYGFHGLSYEWVAAALPALAPEAAAGRVVVAHLGAGVSLCALAGGRSVATTMGFTALEGLPMATRSGSVDPGLVLHLLGEPGATVESVGDLLYRESGLRGVSGLSGDMRRLRAAGTPEAEFAIELFVHRIVQGVGAMAATLGGIDALVFTAGVGEHDAALRAAVCTRLSWLGLAFDPVANAAGGPCLSRPGRVSAWVVPTDEERMIARHVRTLCGSALAPAPQPPPGAVPLPPSYPGDRPS